MISSSATHSAPSNAKSCLGVAAGFVAALLCGGTALLYHDLTSSSITGYNRTSFVTGFISVLAGAYLLGSLLPTTLPRVVLSSGAFAGSVTLGIASSFSIGVLLLIASAFGALSLLVTVVADPRSGVRGMARALAAVTAGSATIGILAFGFHFTDRPSFTCPPGIHGVVGFGNGGTTQLYLCQNGATVPLR